MVSLSFLTCAPLPKSAPFPQDRNRSLEASEALNPQGVWALRWRVRHLRRGFQL